MGWIISLLLIWIFFFFSDNFSFSFLFSFFFAIEKKEIRIHNKIPYCLYSHTTWGKIKIQKNKQKILKVSLFSRNSFIWVDPYRPFIKIFCLSSAQPLLHNILKTSVSYFRDIFFLTHAASGFSWKHHSWDFGNHLCPSFFAILPVFLFAFWLLPRQLFSLSPLKFVSIWKNASSLQ